MHTIDGEDLMCLRQLASLGGIRGPVKISTQALGDLLGISQQTASRRVLALEREHLISRSTDASGQFILITQVGEEVLRREFTAYSKIFDESENKYTLKGIVVSGVGEGRYYMSIAHYQEMFTKLCGFAPYPGTLNVKLNPQSLQLRARLESLDWLIVPGFKDEHRQFGDARCLPCAISGIPCAIVAPLRTHHPSEIIEVICSERLREKLSLTDGSAVEVLIG
ncbi:MAG TPA: DUF120 domain-containing protein [Methanocorpusculum sp.]|nr:DUF120 domain-containing protein [Methanocorpusculum sp.]